MLYDCRYYWKKGLFELRPGAERIFSVGERVCINHKGQKYSGIIVKKERGRGPEQEPHPEIYIRTDELVDLVEGALFEGFGLRGESSLFWREEETEEERKNLDKFYATDIHEEEISGFNNLKPKQKIRLTNSKGSLFSLL